MSDEEREEKPKKAFQLKIVVWDDGEVDTDIREYRKLGTGRGAPSLCGPLKPKQFIDELGNYGISADTVFDTIKNDIVANLLETKQTVQPAERTKNDVEYNPQSEIIESLNEEIESDDSDDLEDEISNMDFDLEDDD